MQFFLQMMSAFQLTVILLICCCCCCCEFGSALKCSSEDGLKNDADIARMMSIGHFGRPFPEKQSQVQSYCAESIRLNRKIDRYKSKCVSGSKKDFTSVIVYSIKKSMKSLCSARNRRLETVLKSMVCANLVSNRTATCYDRFIDRLQGITLAKESEQIPMTCCQYVKLLECIEVSMQNIAKCQSRSEAFLDFIRSIFDDIVNLTCTDYTEHSDRCNQLPDPPAKHVSMKRTKSFILPLMHVWESADQKSL